MKSLAALAACALLAVGCADPDVGATEDNHTATNIDYRVWEEPVELAPDQAIDATIAYGECRTVEPRDEGVDIQIDCSDPWTDVAWFVVRADTIAALETDTLSIDLAVDGTLRGSIFRVTDDGNKKLFASRMLLGDQTISAPIEEVADHYVYVGKGDNLPNLWSTSELDFTVSITPDEAE